jgi:hypothetical protein
MMTTWQLLRECLASGGPLGHPQIDVTRMMPIGYT